MTEEISLKAKIIYVSLAALFIVCLLYTSDAADD